MNDFLEGPNSIELITENEDLAECERERFYTYTHKYTYIFNLFIGCLG